MNYIYYPYLYTLLYLILYIYSLFKFKSKESSYIGRIIVLVYFLAALSSVYFYMNSSYYGQTLTLAPYIYLFITTTICIFPFFDTSRLDTKPIIFSKNSESFLNAFSYLLGFFSLMWFIELFFIGSGGITNIDFASNYGGVDYVGERMSWIGRKFKFISMWTLNILYFLLFYQLSKQKKNKPLILLLLLGSLASPIDALMGGRRFIMVFSLSRYVIFYLLFRQSLNRTVRKYIKYAAVTFLSVMILGLALITISRFDSATTDIDIWTWITLYSGEGPLRFNIEAWEMPVHTQGDNTFTLLKDILGMDPPIEMEDRTRVWGNLHHCMYGVYYTFIGDVFFDFGAIGTFIFVIIYSVFARSKIMTYKGKPGTILIIAMLLQFVLFGITYNPYILYSSQIELMLALLFAYYLNKNTIIRYD